MPLIGRRGDKRVTLWRRVCGRSVCLVIGTLLLSLLVAAVLISATEAPFSDMWWGDHLFLLLVSLPVLALLLGVVLPLVRGLRLPPEQLPALEGPPDGAGARKRSRWAGARTSLLILLGLAILVALGYVEENLRGEHAWQRYQRQEEARGERLNRSALVPPPVPADQNFAATPFLASLLEPPPRVSRYEDVNESGGVQSLAPLFGAALNRVESSTTPRSNSWVVAETDLLAWYAAFLKGTNYSEVSFPGLTNASSAAQQAFRRRYGMERLAPTPRTTQLPAPTSPVPTNTPTRTEAAKGVLAALNECQSVLEELRAASGRPLSRFELRYDAENPASMPMYHYAKLVRLCQILQLRASAGLALGQTEQAFKDVSLIFRLMDATRDEPTLSAQWDRVVELQVALQPLAEGLARHQWSDAQLSALEDRLRQFDFCADGRRGLQGQRVICGGGVLDYLRRSPHRYRAIDSMIIRLGPDDDACFDWRSALLQAIPSGWFYLEKLNCSRTFGDYVLQAIDVRNRRVSPEACRKSEEQLSTMLSDPGLVLVLRHRVFSAFLLPTLSRAVQRVAFAQTGADVAALACALERYRLARREFPAELAALAPQFISRLPHDVITGQPLKYRRTPDGRYILYSVGWNQTDDGGTLGRTKSGRGIDRAAGDWVWQLPL
jgi:hypothetical protein